MKYFNKLFYVTQVLNEGSLKHWLMYPELVSKLGP